MDTPYLLSMRLVPTTPSASESGGELVDTPETPDHGVCERAYKGNGENLPELMSMCLGLQSDDKRLLGQMQLEPYLSMKFKKKVTPTQKHMVEEVKRRSRSSNHDIPSCGYWSRERLHKWLCDNPVMTAVDVKFLLESEKKLHDSIVSAAKAKGNKGTAADAEGSGRNSSWTTNDPYLRLYHCIFADETRDALMRLNEVMTRAELDARNSRERPENFFEAVTRIFNDSNKIFVTDMVPELHHAFAQPIVLDLDDMPSTIDPEECKRRFADARAKLIKIISKWELSGNGFGQRSAEDDDFGHMGAEELEAGDNRANFLDSMTKEHILYFWHLADKNELMKNVLNVIADTSLSDSDNYQPTSEGSSASSVAASHRKLKEAKAANDFRTEMSSAMVAMSQAALMKELRDAESQCMKYEEQIITTDNERLKDLYTKFVKREEKRIATVQEDLDRLVKRRRHLEINEEE
jgi:hypothetical protein